MLRVSHWDNAGAQRWTLSGCLAGPWVEELRSCWNQARVRAPHARAVVDLTEVTFIDDAGESLLADMQRSGTEFVAGGVENRHLVTTLRETGKRPGGVRAADHLSGSCGAPAKPEGGDE